MKGALNTTSAFVILVLLLAVGVAAIWGPFDLAQAYDPLGYKGRQAKQEQANAALQEAIECAYYRCLLGCKTAVGKGACGTVNGQFNEVRFKQFCDERFYEDEAGRICGNNAKALPVETLKSIKFAKIKSVKDEATYKLENKDKKLVDVCVFYEKRDNCDFGTADSDINHVAMEISPEVFSKIDGSGTCGGGPTGANLIVDKDKLFIWAIKPPELGSFLRANLKACWFEAFECVNKQGVDLKKCEARTEPECKVKDSGCKWDGTCKLGNVGQGKDNGPRPCSLLNKGACKDNQDLNLGCAWTGS